MWALSSAVKPFVCWFYTNSLGLVLFRIITAHAHAALFSGHEWYSPSTPVCVLVSATLACLECFGYSVVSLWWCCCQINHTKYPLGLTYYQLLVALVGWSWEVPVWFDIIVSWCWWSVGGDHRKHVLGLGVIISWWWFVRLTARNIFLFYIIIS